MPAGQFSPRLDHSVLRHVAAALACLAVLLVHGVSHAQAPCNSDEVGYIAIFSVKPGHQAQFEAAITHLATTVRAHEPDAILYAPYKGTDNTYYMMERYTNLAAREAHGSAAEVQALFPTLADHLQAPPSVRPVDAVCEPLKTPLPPELL